MFKVTYERFEGKIETCVLWDTEDIIEQYFLENLCCEDFIFESNSYQQAKDFFNNEKTDCKTFINGIYINADVICLYCNNELLESFALPLQKIM